MPGLLWLLLLCLALFVAVVDAWELVANRRRLRRITTRASPWGAPPAPRLMGAAERLLSWYQRDALPYRLARAGNPRFIGETPAHFYTAKLVLALVLAIRLGSHAPGAFVLYAVVGFMVPDFLLVLGTRRRREQLQQQFPSMLDFIRRALSGPGSLRDALSALPDRLTGPLHDETRRLSAQYALTADLPRCLDEFARRTGLEDIDHFCLALKQAEVTGRVKAILGKQADAVKMRLQADQQRNAATQANLLPVVSILMVANIMLLIGLPILFQLTSDLNHL